LIRYKAKFGSWGWTLLRQAGKEAPGLSIRFAEAADLGSATAKKMMSAPK
jgi:hypothetical protein